MDFDFGIDHWQIRQARERITRGNNMGEMKLGAGNFNNVRANSIASNDSGEKSIGTSTR